MKKRLFFKSIYAKFAIVFLGIWWFLNMLTFGVVMFIMSKSILAQLSVERLELYDEFHRLRAATRITFLLSVIIGTVIILLVVRGIVRPIKKISKASKEVAKGNFDIAVDIKSKDEIGQMTNDFNLMIKELKNIDILRKDFISDVSHEFKTPITSIKGFAKLIRDRELSNSQLFEYSNIIVNESERLSLLSTNLLKLSELDSKMIREEDTEFSLDEQIRKTILILENLWSKKEIDFDIELETITIKGNEHLLHEVWLNLIQNAIKFSNKNGKISISLHRIGNKAKVEIIDNGIGMTQEIKSHVFDRFYKADGSRSKDGNGLGLVIAKKIVEISNGEIYFDSEPGKGTSFTIKLPLFVIT